MVNDRRIAANRRNARRSTGPRSLAGRQRSSQNSFRHGLAGGGPTANSEQIQQIERLARKIAGKNTDVLTLESARTIAHAEFDLGQIRRVKAALISRVMAFGEVETRDSFPSQAHLRRLFKRPIGGEKLILPGPVDPPTMPTTEPGRTTEAIRRALAELIKLERYERRAAARCERALHILLERKNDRTT